MESGTLSARLNADRLHPASAVSDLTIDSSRREANSENRRRPPAEPELPAESDPEAEPHQIDSLA